MAAAAEQLTQQPNWELTHQAHLKAEALAHERMTVYIGGITIRGESGPVTPEAPPTATLQETLLRAKSGDPSARRYVRNNVATDIPERLFPVGPHKPVEMIFKGGRLEQEGRWIVDVHRNTLENTVLIPEMMFRARNEIKNALVFEALKTQGSLDTHDAIVFSPSSTRMTTAQKKDYNFFLGTESCSIQRLSVNGNQAALETAFVAGKATPGSERHDIRAIRRLTHNKGVEIMSDDGTDMVSYIVLIPKEELPNGVSSVVELFDEAVGGTFYGEAKASQDYQEYAQKCYERVAGFGNIVDTITNRLIAEADCFKNPMEAILRLDYLADRLCGERAVYDKSIDLAPFGPVAALHFEAARFHLEQGNLEQGNYSLRRGQAISNSSSCPLFKGMVDPEVGDDSVGSSIITESSGKKLMNCPECDAKVFADPCARVLCCWDCGAKASNGRVSPGNGGSKARQAKKVAEEKHRTETAKLSKSETRELALSV